MPNRKVLVVDDEIHIVHVVAIKLRNNGYDVITASNGCEAYELACKEKPDIIISDCQMPLMTGLELVEKLRETEETRDIPLIMLTARSFEIEEEFRRRFNVSACLSKPFSPKELLMHINDVIHMAYATQAS